MLRIKIFYFVIILSALFQNCSPTKEKEIEALIKYKGVKKEPCNPFNKVILNITIKNNTKDSLFIEGVSPHIFIEDSYPSLLVNYGGYKKEINAKLNSVKLFIENKYKKLGNVKDTLNITIPILTNKYQTNSLKDSVDIFEIYDNLSSLYENADLFCRDDLYRVPVPPDCKINGPIESELNRNLHKQGVDDECERALIIKNYIESTLFINPHEKVTISYDIGMLFLRRSTYKIQFSISELNQNSFFEGLKTIKSYKRYKKEIKTDVLFITSK